jgi:hypothetical protein
VLFTHLCGARRTTSPGAETFARYGPVLRANADAASQDPWVEEVYRLGLMEGLIVAVVEALVTVWVSTLYGPEP